MECVGSSGDWNSFSGIFSTEETDFVAQFLGNHPVPSEQCEDLSFETTSHFWPSHQVSVNTMGFVENSYSYPDSTNFSSYSFPIGSRTSSSSNLQVLTMDQDSCYMSNPDPMLVTNDFFAPMNNFSMVDEYAKGGALEENSCFKEEMGFTESDAAPLDSPVISGHTLQLKRKSETAHNDIAIEKNPKKARASGSVPKNKKNAPTKKKQKLDSICNNEEESNADLNRQSSSSCSSEDDTNVTQELSEGASLTPKESKALNLSGKTRASRGSATDPQSLYARKRRERINERLRVLQTLVPNGTKVDISTMLEEAVQYVKFLQLQIKLLSSDDLWMYAPLAYNGMDLGLDLKISLPQ